MLHYPEKSSASFEFDVLPDSRITNIHCAIHDGGPCAPCKEFQQLQSSIIQATLARNGYADIPLAQRARDLDLRKQINQQHNIMKDLPIEVCTKIFEFYCSPPHANSFPPQVMLLSICTAWRALAIESPRLWTVFPVPGISADPFCIEQVKSWFQYSKLPISIEFKRPDIYKDELISRLHELEEVKNAIADIVMANKHRICAIDIKAATLEVLQLKMMSGTPEPPGLWPMLSHITIDTLRTDQAIEILRCCRQATFVNFKELRGNSRPSQHACNPFLAVLEVGFDPCESSDPAAFFEYIEAPALKEVICLSNTPRSPIPGLQTLVQQSACSLHRLHLIQLKFDSNELIELLTSQPSLRTLAIACIRYDRAHVDLGDQSAFAAFTTLLLTNAKGNVGVGKEYTTGRFLPCLEVFRYAGQMVQIWPWTALVDVLSSHTDSVPADSGQDDLQQLQDFTDGRASSIGYRPLRLLKFVVIESRSYHADIHESWRSDLNQLATLPYNPRQNDCRFECNFCTNLFLANVLGDF